MTLEGCAVCDRRKEEESASRGGVLVTLVKHAENSSKRGSVQRDYEVIPGEHAVVQGYYNLRGPNKAGS
jgi:hypothetical protein